MKSNRILVCLGLFFFLFSFPIFSQAAPMGTAFTYQGRLTDGSGVANGTYDFEFRLYGSVDGSDSIGSMVPKDNVTVSNGFFSVLLDFGSSSFTGEARWLEIKVRPDGGGSFVPMSPRQLLTPTPYALYAPSAGSAGSIPWTNITNMPAGFADGIDNDTQYSAGTGLNLSGTQFNLLSNYQLPQGCTSGQLPKWNGSLWTCQADSDTTYSAGTGLSLAGGQFTILPLFQLPQTGCSTGYVPKWNGSAWICSPDIDTTYSAGTGLGLSGDQFSVSLPYRLPQSCTNNYVPKWNSSTSQWICAADNDTTTYWGLTGNSGTVTGNFVGTVDNQPLEFRVSNLRALRIEPNATSPNIIGGYSGNNVTSGVKGATIGGGGENSYLNQVTDDYGTVGGGYYNTAGDNSGTTTDSPYATIGGGSANWVRSGHSTIAGGHSNLVESYGYSSTIGGGTFNQISGRYSTICGGRNNKIEGSYSTIGGGGPSDPLEPTDVTRNRVTDDYGTIGGGGNNQAGDDAGTPVDNPYATVGGGMSNQATRSLSTIAGGASNNAINLHATIGGGIENTASGNTSTISGGSNNASRGSAATVGAGSNNQANGDHSTIGGGNTNLASGLESFVGGGYSNEAGGGRSTIGGGYNNAASGNADTVPGGADNLASGGYSFAAGNRAKAADVGSFVWSSGLVDTFSWGDNTFSARSPGGARFYSSTAGTGVQLSAGGSSWGVISDRKEKENFKEVDLRRVLDTFSMMPVSSWNLKAQPRDKRHIGPIAQDFNGSFGYLFGELESPVHINTMDAIGVSMAAIQGLYQMVIEKEARIEGQQTQINTLQEQISRLEESVRILKQAMAGNQGRVAHLSK